MLSHPILYEINTRPWLRRFATTAKRPRLAELPAALWDGLWAQGVDYLWLMGIWQGGAPESVRQYCFEPGLAAEYGRALPDWREADVIGSPYAIDCYELNPELTDRTGLAKLRTQLAHRNIKLILDFVPNHFHAETSLLLSQPEIFLSALPDFSERDSLTYFRPVESGPVYAHGRDPYFPAWQDTLQVNYWNPAAREFMLKQLLQIAEQADGVRCDMAMLVLNDVIAQAWGDLQRCQGTARPETEFWAEAIATVKAKHPDFIFIAETYWDLEFRLQELGFDYTYDKRLLERLEQGDPAHIRAHLTADYQYQRRLLRFLENHDEPRAAAAFPPERREAAALIMSTLPGMRLYYDGQFEGHKVRLPVQLGREPLELPNEAVAAFYQLLLQELKEPVFKKGDWSLVQVQSGSGDESFRNILAWQWSYAGHRRWVLVNYSAAPANAHAAVDCSELPEEVELVDLLNCHSFQRRRADLGTHGLYVELGPWQSHLLRVGRN